MLPLMRKGASSFYAQGFGRSAMLDSSDSFLIKIFLTDFESFCLISRNCLIGKASLASHVTARTHCDRDSTKRIQKWWCFVERAESVGHLTDWKTQPKNYF